MSIFIQEVLGLLKRNQKKITLDKTKDWFEFGKLYQSSSLNNKSSYTPKMDPFVIKWGDLVCQATEDLTRTLPGQGNFGYIPVYTDPSGFCSWDTLKDSIITQNALNTTINIGGSLVVAGDAAINGCDLTSTCTSFNLLNQPTTITFGSGAANIFIGRPDPTSTVTIVGTQDSNACTNGALVVNGGVGIAKNLNVCEDLTVQGRTYLNGNVTLGDSISDDIILKGQLIDNYGNGPLPNQVLVGQGGGLVAWQIDDIVETLSYGSLWQGNASNVKQELTIGSADQILISDGTTFSWQNNPAVIVGEVCAVNSIPLWTPNSNTLGCSLIYQDGNSSTPATKIFLKGGLASETSQVRTITDVALGYGNYAGGQASAAFNFRSLALGNDSFAAGHKAFAGGHGSFVAGYNSGAGNYGFGLFVNTITSSTLDINILSGTIAVGDFIYANVDTDPSIRYEILTLVGTGTIGLNTITIATPISVNANEAVAIEEAVPNRGDSQGAVAIGYNAVSKVIGAIAIGTRANTDIKDQIAIGSSFTTVKLDGTSQDNTQNKVLVIDSNNIVRWREASTIGGGGSGTVTSVAALTLGTTGTDLSSTVANGTTTPVITLQVPTASATNRGALSSADWSTFNGKQGTITLTTTGTSGAATFSANTLNIPNYGSALSGYVPYTGATQTLALGTNNGITLTDTSTNVSISITSSSTGSGAIYVNKSGTGTGIQVANNGTGFGFYANNISTGYGITIGNSSTGKGLYIDNAAAATGDPFVYTLGGAAFVKAKIDYLGNITGVAANFTGQLTLGSSISNGTYTYTLPSATGTLALVGGAGVGTVTSVSGVGSVSGLTLTGTVTSSGDLTLGGTLSLTSSDVTNGLGYTPYNATNPDGYTSFAEPGIYSGGGTPTLAAGVTAQEVRDLIGAGTPIVDTDFVKNTADTYASTSKVTQIVTLTQAEYDLIPSPLNSTLYVIL